MPVLIPLVVGFAAGVCVAPTIRRHPKLRKVFAVVDAFQERVKDAFRNAWQATTMANLHPGQPVRLFSPN